MLLLFLSITLSICIKFSLTERCACSEFDQLTCTYSYYCSWDGQSCIDLVCKYKSESLCIPLFTSYSCKWNETSKSCEDHQYECSEFNQDLCFGGFIYGYNCMWQDDKCKPQDCTNNNQCHPLECSSSNQQCGQKMDNLDCSSYTNETCQVSDGYGNVCLWNDQNECKEYHALTSSCSDYEDRIKLCSGICYYDTVSESCIQKECSQNTDESACKSFLLDIPSLQLVPCKWSNNTCNEMTEEDFKNANFLQCLESQLQLGYTWQNSTTTCKQCTSFVHNPMYDQYVQLMDGFQIFKLGLVLLALYI